ncbi:hypothetical protein AAHE18_16G128600 [Arachis hypogaea]
MEEWGLGKNKKHEAQLDESGLGLSDSVMDDPVEENATRLAVCVLDTTPPNAPVRNQRSEDDTSLGGRVSSQEECFAAQGQVGEQETDDWHADVVAEEMRTVASEPRRGREEHEQCMGDATIGNQIEGSNRKRSKMKPDEVEGRGQVTGDAKHWKSNKGETLEAGLGRGNGRE